MNDNSSILTYCIRATGVGEVNEWCEILFSFVLLRSSTLVEKKIMKLRISDEMRVYLYFTLSISLLPRLSI
ncbi:unnamed protein product, partial [Trichogramma brassicae]